jgi:hypothetical protein
MLKMSFFFSRKNEKSHNFYSCKVLSTVVRIYDNFKYYSTVDHLLIRLASIYFKLKTNNTNILIDEKYQY